MEIEVALADDIARVKLRGRLDTHGVDQIETKFTASIVPGGRNAVVDLSEVAFISSMGLRMFIAVATALKRHGGKMALFAPQAQVSDVFASAALSAVVPVVRDEAEAVGIVTAQ